MNISTESLAIFAVLIPGFVSSTILNMIVVRKPKDALSTLIEALMFSFVVYVVLVGLFRISPVVNPGSLLPATVGEIGKVVNPFFVVWALIASLLLPLIVGAVANRDLHMKLFRAIGITSRSSRLSVWLDVFMDQNRYVICNLSGGRRVFGWPMYYSDGPEQPLVYLYEPAWINDDGTYTELDIHGLFLVEKDGIESIEFTKVSRENAQAEKEEGEPNG
jgi:hypothetical protein